MIHAKEIVWELQQNVHSNGLVFIGIVPNSSVKFTITYEGDGLPGALYVLECSIGRGVIKHIYLNELKKQAQIQLDNLVNQLIEEKRVKLTPEQNAFRRKYGKYADKLNLKLELK